jgi:molybdopterin molybdotransferase
MSLTQSKIGLGEALNLLEKELSPLRTEEVSLLDALDRILGADIFARVNVPSVDASTKDGYAVVSSDIDHASEQHPVLLKQSSIIHAGDELMSPVTSGTTVRILTGARIPPGAQSVVAEEFTRKEGNYICVMNNAEPGRNILFCGSDIENGRLVGASATQITPGLLGLLAAAGYSRLPVIKKPSVAIIATGDEVVSPGKPLSEGKLYASNLITLSAWCQRFGFDVELDIVEDSFTAIERSLSEYHQRCDAIITSGGAWTGEHDLVAKVLEEMGGRTVFHRLRIGPGKATGLVLLNDRPVFILPGGPPSNLMGFLQIALPGLCKLAGMKNSPISETVVRLTKPLHTRFPDWTQFIYGRLEETEDDDTPLFSPIVTNSRLRSMAEADAVVAIAEGITDLPEGKISAQLLS